jgi:phage terminase large subunit-like protein
MNLNNLNNKTDAELEEIAESLQAISNYNKYNKLKLVFPDTGPLRRELYGPAMEFLRKGKEHRFRVYMGGNRSGKSFTTLVELCYHLTGMYPEWWEGKVFKKPTTVWIIGESGALFRDSAQRLLFGEAGEEIGTGLLPLAEKNDGIGIIDYYAMPGTPGAIGSAIIKHKSGCSVSLIVKTNEMQREQFQAAKVDVILFDEEPREDIYTECLMRLMGIGKTKEPGIAMLAFTPLKGLSEVVLKFLPNGQFPDKGSPIENPDQYICRVEWDQVPHLSKEDQATMINQIPKNERDARRKGIPSLGSGKIYPIDEDQIVIKPFAIPDYWPRAFGMDFGWHKTACLWAAKDPTTDDLYIYAEYYRGEEIPAIHALNIKAKGEWIPGISDPSGGGRQAGGQMLVDIYRALGLDLTEGENSIEAGIARNLDLFERGKLKIFSTLQNTLNELRIYRYDSKDPNKPAKNQADHLMDCLKYLTSLFDWVATSFNDHESRDRVDNIKLTKSNRDTLTGY